MNQEAKQHLCWSILDQAIAYVEHGLSVVPLRLDGSKGPAGGSWKWRQESIPKWTDLRADFHDRPAGIGIVCGVVSGGLEVLDFDAGDLFFPWRELVRLIVGKLPVVRTPKGFHVFYRCDEISGNAKIAYLTGRKEAAIETRGEGGFVVAAGSPAAVHPSGKSYVQFSGPSLPGLQLEPGQTIEPGVGIPVISPAERAELWAAARSFDQSEQIRKATEAAAKQAARQHRGPQLHASDTSTPWGHYDAQGPAWRDILEPHGWTSKDGIQWKRPGKQDDGHSAAIRTADSGCDVLVVWSSSAGPLAPAGTGHRTVGKFDAYAALNHNGDKRSAARELSRQGWGRRSAS
jgi:hypothetical protein